MVAGKGGLQMPESGCLKGSILRFVCHSHTVLKIAAKFGWAPGARYMNLRDVRRFDRLGFLDIDWQNYNHRLHLEAARITRPFLTVARDIMHQHDLPEILDEANHLSQYAEHVVVVPKDIKMQTGLEELIPTQFLLGYSVPTRYGGTTICPTAFRRPVHLRGGRPDVQRRLAEKMNVFSLDCNRFTYDASFGDFFDGERFREHPTGGYQSCIEASLHNINRLWEDYMPAMMQGYGRAHAVSR
jgi:hypothetical protein